MSRRSNQNKKFTVELIESIKSVFHTGLNATCENKTVGKSFKC